MKYIIFIIDGVADRPLKELGGKTPLQVAKKDNIDYLAEKGRCGLCKTIPENFSNCSGVANLSIIGYDPLKYFPGRGVLEAAAMGIHLKDTDVIFRCNTISVTDDNRIKNHSAGRISSKESVVLIEEANKQLGSDEVIFYPGAGFRNVILLQNSYSSDVECFPPHEYMGHFYKELLVKPKNSQAVKTAELLNRIIEVSREFLERHPVNIRRKKEGKDIANMLWPWAPGKKPIMKTFYERFGIKGAIISDMDVVKGIGVYCGFDVIDVEDISGFYNINYEGRADACVNALKDNDFVYVHVKATDEASHEGNLELKIQCIDAFDKRLVGNILPRIDIQDTVIAVLPDHYTSVQTRKHSTEPVPFLIYDPLLPPDNVKKFDEESCSSGAYGLCKGESFINLVIRRSI